MLLTKLWEKNGLLLEDGASKLFECVDCPCAPATVVGCGACCLDSELPATMFVTLPGAVKNGIGCNDCLTYGNATYSLDLASYSDPNPCFGTVCATWEYTENEAYTCNCGSGDEEVGFKIVLRLLCNFSCGPSSTFCQFDISVRWLSDIPFGNCAGNTTNAVFCTDADTDCPNYSVTQNENLNAIRQCDFVGDVTISA